ncbi:MAG: hypothetical protein NTY02_16875, partial [Acidobacteria bacterium]|nr:hypothetical protein [Acidobacteriota bacterium]
PAYGAAITYYLQAAPPGNVTITILDQQEQVVRTLTGTKAVGVNRIHWDLRHEPTEQVRLRTRPPTGPDARLGPDGLRPSADGGRLSVLASPGTYMVKLSVGGREFTQPLTVRKDPNAGGTEADIQAQTKVLLDLRRAMNSAVDVVNQSEIVRSQIERVTDVIEDAAIRKAGIALTQKLIDLELTLLQLRATGRGGEASKLLSKILYLANEMGSADFKPTDQQLEVQMLLEERVRTCQKQFDELRKTELAAFNELLRKRNIKPIITTAVEPTGQQAAAKSHDRIAEGEPSSPAPVSVP